VDDGAPPTGDRLEDSDESLMRRVARGDRDAGRALVARHLARVVAFAGRTLGSRAEAEDVAQETFLRLWTHAGRWRPEAALSTWLHRIAYRLCLDRIARRRETSLDDAGDPPDEGPSMTTRIQDRTLARTVNAALATLPESQRAAIALCHFDGMRNAEAAAVLDVSVEALESLLARGRRKLKAALAGVAPELLATGDDR
jgi:RNA polymerase sigma-70 factor (ECF subfamily)